MKVYTFQFRWEGCIVVVAENKREAYDKMLTAGHPCFKAEYYPYEKVKEDIDEHELEGFSFVDLGDL